MRPLRALALYIVVVFIGGALLAPWLYWLVQSFAHQFPKIAASPFHRFVDRSLLGIALIGIWPLMRSLGVTSLRDLGLCSPAGQWRRLLGGLSLGFVSLAIVAVVAIAAGARSAAQMPPPARLAGKLAGVVLTAVAVAVLEEILFRGGIFGALRKVSHWVVALAASSMIYAIVHFMQKAELAGPVTWHSGLDLLPAMLSGFADLHSVVPGFFNLTLAGVLLGLAYQWTGTLYFSIGLHAGWIFWLKAYGTLTRAASGTNTWWWGTTKLIDGWFALPVLLGVLAVFYLWPAKRRDNSA